MSHCTGSNNILAISGHTTLRLVSELLSNVHFLKLNEQSSLQSLPKKNCKHLLHGTIYSNINPLGLNTILHEEVPNVDVTQLQPARRSVVLLKLHRAFDYLAKTRFWLHCTLAKPKTF
jgi:hypothetical protein